MSDLYTLKRIIRNQETTQAELDALQAKRDAVYKELNRLDNMLDLTYRKREDYNRELKQWEARYCVQAIDS